MHQWRTEEQAILIGYNTLLADNPFLTARLVNGKNPVRLVLAHYPDISRDLNVFNEDAKTVVFNAVTDSVDENIEFVKIDWNNKASQVLDYCFKNNISSIIIEGGTNTIYNFTNKHLWDEARVFINPDKYFEHGITAPEIHFDKSKPVKVGNDLLYTFLNM